MGGGNHHHYAIDAAKLVDKCRMLLHAILDHIGSSSSGGGSSLSRHYYYLVDLSDALKCVDRLIHTHLLDLLDREMEFLSTISNDAQIQFFGEHEEFPSLMDTVETLRSAETVARGYRDKQSINGSKVVFGDYNNDGDTTASSPATFTNNNIHHSAFSDVSSTNMHRRRVSSPPNLYTGSLSIDDPVEEDENDGGLWYYGGNTGSTASVVGSNGTVKSGRRSPSPPRVQSAEDSSCGTAHNKTVSTINSSSISSSSNSSNNCNGNRKSRTHRRNFSTGGIGLSNSSASFSAKHENNYCPSRSAKDSSLFRLIVTLQLCLVRIEEVNSVLCKGRAVGDGDQSRGLDERDGQGGRSRSSCRLRPDLKSCSSIDSELSVILPRRAVTNNQKLFTQPYSSYWKKSQIFAISSIGIGATFYFATRSKSTIGNAERIKLLKTTGKVAAGALAASFIRKRWRILCMNARVTNTSAAIEDWIFHWICLAHDSKSDYGHKQSRKTNAMTSTYSHFRFQLMKRGMDLLYASIGKAFELTRGQQSNDRTDMVEVSKSSGLWTSVVAALAASYYNVIGPAAKSAQVVSSSSPHVIQNAWGMVSLPAVKKASLEATRILKGAAIADRIELYGVTCFVLSREPFPALASALRRFHRQQEREDVRLGTIHEQVSEYHHSVNVKGFQRRNVVLHLTGGGFFAHTIAGDLPYLLDWSAATDSVIIIPEYALLPHHKCPHAVAEVARIYRSLRCGQAASVLGFQPDRIIVSGESVGGNLAASLCVTIVMDYNEGSDALLTPSRSMELVSDRDDASSDAENEEADGVMSPDSMIIDLPDALMMCCPMLNMSLDSTPSRLDGANDPVLPSGLIAAISNTYLPVGGEFPKNHPVASPYFATDAILRKFPPTLIFTSSGDPFLDDQVNFIARLRSVGVKSSLRAVHDMPHAFWALATAGIPEARHVQNECEDWLSKMFSDQV